MRTIASNNNLRLSQLNEVITEMDKEMEIANAKIKYSDLKGYESSRARLSELDKKYELIFSHMTYDDLLREQLPLVEAIKKLVYTTKKHVEDKDTNGRATAVKRVDAERQISLLKFCKYAEIDTLWEHKVSKFNQLLCLYTAQKLGYSKSQLDEMATSYYLRDKVNEIDLGKTPTSHSQILKNLQGVIDAIIFEPDEKGNNIYKATIKDAYYILNCYTRRKKAKVLAVSRDAFMHTLVQDVLNMILTNDGVSVTGFKRVKETTAEVQSPEVQPPEAEKVETEMPEAKTKKAKAKKAKTESQIVDEIIAAVTVAA